MLFGCLQGEVAKHWLKWCLSFNLLSRVLKLEKYAKLALQNIKNQLYQIKEL